MPDFKRKMKVQAPNSPSHTFNINHMLIYHTPLIEPPPSALSDPTFTDTHTKEGHSIFPRKPQPHHGMKAHLDFPDPEDVFASHVNAGK